MQSIEMLAFVIQKRFRRIDVLPTLTFSPRKHPPGKPQDIPPDIPQGKNHPVAEPVIGSLPSLHNSAGFRKLGKPVLLLADQKTDEIVPIVGGKSEKKRLNRLLADAPLG